MSAVFEEKKVDVVISEPQLIEKSPLRPSREVKLASNDLNASEKKTILTSFQRNEALAYTDSSNHLSEWPHLSTQQDQGRGDTVFVSQPEIGFSAPPIQGSVGGSLHANGAPTSIINEVFTELVNPNRTHTPIKASKHLIHKNRSDAREPPKVDSLSNPSNLSSSSSSSSLSTGSITTGSQHTSPSSRSPLAPLARLAAQKKRNAQKMAGRAKSDNLDHPSHQTLYHTLDTIEAERADNEVTQAAKEQNTETSGASFINILLTKAEGLLRDVKTSAYARRVQLTSTNALPPPSGYTDCYTHMNSSVGPPALLTVTELEEFRDTLTSASKGLMSDQTNLQIDWLIRDVPEVYDDDEVSDDAVER